MRQCWAFISFNHETFIEVLSEVVDIRHSNLVRISFMPLGVYLFYNILLFFELEISKIPEISKDNIKITSTFIPITLQLDR